MSSRCRSIRLAAALLLACAPVANAAPSELRVCADPNNLPFSDAQGRRLREPDRRAAGPRPRRARHLHLARQRRGFVRNTLKAGPVRRLMGVPAGYRACCATTGPTTAPATSSSRAASREPSPRSTTRRCARSRSACSSSATTAPTRRRSTRWRGAARSTICAAIPIYGDYDTAAPAAAIVDAVARGEVDIAVVWGPIAGYFAKAEPVPLRLVPIAGDGPVLPMSFAIAMGVRRTDTELRDTLDRSARPQPAGDRRHPGRVRRAAAAARRGGELRCRPEPSPLPRWRWLAALPACKREERDSRPQPVAERAEGEIVVSGLYAGAPAAAAARLQGVRGERLPRQPGQAALQRDELRRLPRQRRRRDGSAADGRCVDLRQRAAEHLRHHRRGPAERDAVLPRQASRAAGLGAGRLRPLDERTAAPGRRPRRAATT